MSGRRKAIIGGGAVVGLAAAGAAVFGAMWYFGTGPQPAEALPDSTIAYVGLDIDPSGKQLLEAKETLEKFPLWNDQEISGRSDLRAAVFDELLAEAPCDLDYADDIEPWLGDRAAMAAVDLGEDQPTPVGVVQVKDADEAEAAFERIAGCDDGSDVGGWAINGEWAVIAETEEIAEEVAEQAQDDPLSGDEDFERWTDEAGDAGILTAYAAPEAGPWIAEGFGSMGSDLDTDGGTPPEVDEALEAFPGAALTIRFEDGGVELETATGTDAFGFGDLAASEDADDAISSLPDDTAAALGFGFSEGWFEEVVAYLGDFSGGMFDVDALLEMVEAESGLELPEDAETLAGESVAVSLAGDFDPEAFLHADDAVDELPVAAKIKGDTDEIQDILDSFLGSDVTTEDDARILANDAEGDYVAVGPDGDYRDEVLEGGDLGGSDVFEKVVEDPDRAASILFVNFDAGDGWLERLAGDNEIGDNLAPLEAAGLSAWMDDDVAHAVLRITTE